MSVMYIRGEDGKFYPVTSLKGEKGDPGEVDYSRLAGGTITTTGAALTFKNGSGGNAFVTFDTTAADATVGMYNSLAYICNEGAAGARIGVYRDGTPQFWTGRTSDTAKTLLHTGNAEEKLGISTEEWTFELEDGTTVTKQVIVK